METGWVDRWDSHKSGEIPRYARPPSNYGWFLSGDAAMTRCQWKPPALVLRDTARDAGPYRYNQWQTNYPGKMPWGNTRN